jgi:hypothetical protein
VKIAHFASELTGGAGVAAQGLKVFISSCGTSESFYGRELKRMAGLCMSLRSVFVDRPEDADLILVVDMDEADVFANLRRNRVWRRFPEKSFGIYEGDNPPRFLHGIYTAVPRDWTHLGRFQSCGLWMHQVAFPLACPAPDRAWETPKSLLFSFMGRISHPVRRRLLQLSFPTDGVVMVDTSTYNHFQTGPKERSPWQDEYWPVAQRSKYVLCPSGSGATCGTRLFDMMQAGIAPVIICDKWVPPLGPNWDEFALFVAERDIKHLYGIIKEHDPEWKMRGQKARQAYENWFAPDTYWASLVGSIRKIQQQQRVPEKVYARILPWMTLLERTRQARIRSVIWMKGMVRKSWNDRS